MRIKRGWGAVATQRGRIGADRFALHLGSGDRWLHDGMDDPAPSGQCPKRDTADASVSLERLTYSLPRRIIEAPGKAVKIRFRIATVHRAFYKAWQQRTFVRFAARQCVVHKGSPCVDHCCIKLI